MLRPLLGTLYSGFVAFRNARYNRGKGVRRVAVPVISVGNLSVGGSGKSPVVAAIVRELQRLGHRPALISRGYRRSSRGVVVVSDGLAPLVEVDQSGDELAMLAHSLPGCVVIAAEVRFHGATRAIREFEVDCIVLDDAFQHRQFGRDLDIVIVDRATLDNSQVLPQGLLREPLKNLKRASCVLLRESVDSGEVREYTTAPLFPCRTVVDRWTDIQGQTTSAPSGTVFAFCAIAQPERFRATLEAEDIDCGAERYFRDHHFFSESDCNELVAEALSVGASTLVCTEKDAVKLEQFAGIFKDAGLDLRVLCIKMAIENSDGWAKLMGEVFHSFQNTNKA